MNKQKLLQFQVEMMEYRNQFKRAKGENRLIIMSKWYYYFHRQSKELLEDSYIRWLKECYSSEDSRKIYPDYVLVFEILRHLSPDASCLLKNTWKSICINMMELNSRYCYNPEVFTEHINQEIVSEIVRRLEQIEVVNNDTNNSINVKSELLDILMYLRNNIQDIVQFDNYISANKPFKYDTKSMEELIRALIVQFDKIA